MEHDIKDIHQKKEDEQNEIGGTGRGSDEEEQDGDDDKYDQTFEEKVSQQKGTSTSSTSTGPGRAKKLSSVSKLPQAQWPADAQQISHSRKYLALLSELSAISFAQPCIYSIGSPRWYCGPHQPHLIL